jgi:hypothetical protein
MNLSELNPDLVNISSRQKQFIIEYLIDHNATRAARAAGYNEKYAGRYGHKLVHDPRIKEELSRLQAKKREISGITQEYVLYNLRDILESIKDEKTPAYLQVKLRTNELLGKYLGLWNKEDGSQQRRVGELTDKELVALGMELAKSRNAEPKQIDATIIDAKVGNAVGKDKDT